MAQTPEHVSIENTERAFNALCNPSQEERRQLAALALIAAHALTVAPQATHMLLEASDQGEYMCVPSYLAVDEDYVAEQEWDAWVKDHEDDPLHLAPSWLPHFGRWQHFVDDGHSFTNRRSGYYAVDLRRVVTETAEQRSMGGWTHPDHLPGITVTTWGSDAGAGLHDGALVVQVDTDGSASDRRIRINLNDGPVWDGIPAFDAQPGRFRAADDEDERIIRKYDSN